MPCTRADRSSEKPQHRNSGGAPARCTGGQAQDFSETCRGGTRQSDRPSLECQHLRGLLPASWPDSRGRQASYTQPAEVQGSGDQWALVSRPQWLSLQFKDLRDHLNCPHGTLSLFIRILGRELCFWTNWMGVGQYRDLAPFRLTIFTFSSKLICGHRARMGENCF